MAWWESLASSARAAGGALLPSQRAAAQAGLLPGSHPEGVHVSAQELPVEAPPGRDERQDNPSTCAASQLSLYDVSSETSNRYPDHYEEKRNGNVSSFAVCHGEVSTG